jgi:hypothetical protein
MVALRERRQFGHPGLGRQCLQPFDLDADAVADQRVLAEVIGEAGDLAAIAAVERRDGGER